MATVVKKDNQPKDSLEIKTRSIEQTLLPLIKQISTLVEHRSESSMREPIATPAAWARVGQALSVAVERFVTVGETIADDHSEVRQGMYEACKEARQAGAAIEHLCEAASEETVADRGAVVRASRALLASVTRVLLLADIVVVKQLLLAKDKVQRSLGRLESVSNFTEFVKAFSQFGAEMVELAHLTGDRQNDLKDERRRAQMAAARQVLERSTMMLLTSSKACLRHPESVSARENRDTIFCQMRRAMDLIHYVVKDGVLSCSGMQSPTTQSEEWETDRTTVSSSIRHLEHLVELCRLTDHEIPHRSDNNTGSQIGPALDALLERSHDFTDSPYTSHEHRQKILVLLDSLADRVSHLIEAYEMCATDIDADVDAVLDATRALWLQLWRCAADQAGELTSLVATGRDAIHAMRSSPQQHTSPTSRRPDQAFHDCIEHTLEICKLVRHVALTETLQVAARFAETNLRVYGPQVVTAWRTLQEVPQSQIAAENLEVFSDMYQWLASDITTTAREVLENSSGHRQSSDKQVYLSLPRPGKHGTTSKPLKAVRLDSEEQAKIAKSGLEMKMMSSEMDAETDKWQETGTAAMEENNDIVKRAKNMSAMAFSMYQFTRGEGSLKTTQDLFTQAEYFAEEANRLYKVVRQFSYQVPGGANKKELLENLDRVPTFVQQLQFTVKDPTVGKAATFIKVDNVIQETKNLMNVISKVVTTCFECASKYKLELGGGNGDGALGGDSRSGAGGSMGGGGAGGQGSGMGGGGGGGEGSL